jgi:hypothetical protein
MGETAANYVGRRAPPPTPPRKGEWRARGGLPDADASVQLEINRGVFFDWGLLVRML